MCLPLLWLLTRVLACSAAACYAVLVGFDALVLPGAILSPAAADGAIGLAVMLAGCALIPWFALTVITGLAWGLDKAGLLLQNVFWLVSWTGVLWVSSMVTGEDGIATLDARLPLIVVLALAISVLTALLCAATGNIRKMPLLPVRA